MVRIPDADFERVLITDITIFGIKTRYRPRRAEWCPVGILRGKYLAIRGLSLLISRAKKNSAYTRTVEGAPSPLYLQA